MYNLRERWHWMNVLNVNCGTWIPILKKRIKVISILIAYNLEAMLICSVAARFQTCKWSKARSWVSSGLHCSLTLSYHTMLWEGMKSLWIIFGVLLTILHKFKALLLWGMEEGSPGATPSPAYFCWGPRLIFSCSFAAQLFFRSFAQIKKKRERPFSCKETWLLN